MNKNIYLYKITPTKLFFINNDGEKYWDENKNQLVKTNNFFNQQHIDSNLLKKIIIGINNNFCEITKSNTNLFSKQLRKYSMRYPIYSLCHFEKKTYIEVFKESYLEKNIQFQDVLDCYAKNIYEFESKLDVLIKKHKNKKKIFIGGNHSLTYFTASKLSEFEPINLIIFDAHNDMMHNLNDNIKIKNDNFISHLVNKKNIGKIYKVGKRGIRSIFQQPINKDKVIDISSIKELESVLNYNDKYYISIDLDVLDPNVFPLVNHPISNGMGLDELLEYIEVILKYNVISADIVEGIVPCTQKEYHYLDIPLQILLKLLNGLN